MKKIQLGGNKYKDKPIRGYAIVDDDDYDHLIKYKWHLYKSLNTGYAVSYENGKHIQMHRWIMKAKDGQCIDHINRNGLDNRKKNLRICTHSENMFNTRLRRDNPTGFRGVINIKTAKKKCTKLWCARININKKRFWLGSFSTKKQAILAYKIAYNNRFITAQEIQNSRFKS